MFLTRGPPIRVVITFRRVAVKRWYVIICNTVYPSEGCGIHTPQVSTELSPPLIDILHQG
jgi:hypothetical protein